MNERERRPQGGWANEIVIYMSEHCCLYFDLNDKKMKVDGGSFDSAAVDLADKLSYIFDRKIQEILKNPEKMDTLLSSIVDGDELTNMLLRYKLLIEKKLFGRT